MKKGMASSPRTSIAPPREAGHYPDRQIDCQAAIEPAFVAWAERAEAAGVPNYRLIDIALAFKEQSCIGAPGTQAEEEFPSLAAEAKRAGWSADETAAALVELAVRRCQAALANGDTEAMIQLAQGQEANPNGGSAQFTRAEIRRLLNRAIVMFGPSIELITIEKSWGDTLDDRETLQMLRNFVELRSLFSGDGDPVDDLNSAYEGSQTRH